MPKEMPKDETYPIVDSHPQLHVDTFFLSIQPPKKEPAQHLSLCFSKKERLMFILGDKKSTDLLAMWGNCNSK